MLENIKRVEQHHPFRLGEERLLYSHSLTSEEEESEAVASEFNAQ